MKPLAIIIIFTIFTPVAIYGQVPTNIIKIETGPPSNGNTSDVPNSFYVMVTIEGDLKDGGNVNLIVQRFFDSAYTVIYGESYTFPKDNPTHFFEIDYPFQPDEVYYVMVINGPYTKSIQWVPLSTTQEESSTEQYASEESNSVQPLREQDSNLVQPLREQDSNLVQSLREENERLRQEIAKKDAIIMEQLKVIQDLASQLRNAVFDTRYPLTMLT